MGRTVTYERVESALADFSYPLVRDDAAAELADVTVTFGDGDEANLGALVSETHSDSFDEIGDLRDELADVVDAHADE